MNNTDTYTILSKGILGLQTNVESFQWSFGNNAPLESKSAFEACEVKVELLVQPDADFGGVQRSGRRDTLGKYHFFSGLSGGGRILYERPFVLRSKLFLEASGLDGPKPLLRANSNYRKFVRYRFMNLHSLNFVLTDLVALLLLRKKLAAIHCSAFKKDGSTVVVYAPSNTGKTLATMMACLELGGDFISEDLAITDGRQVFGVPWTSTFRYYGEVDKRWWARTVNRAKTLFPILNVLPLVSSRPITSFPLSKPICDRATATHLVILERGPSLVRSVEREEAYHKVCNLNRSEFNYQRSLLNNAYEFFNPELDISAAAETEKQILKALVDNVKDCLVVRTENPTEYARLILSAIS